MKKSLLSMAVIVAAMTACSREESVEQIRQPLQMVNLVVGIDGSADTKVTGVKGDETDEEKVNSLQVFIFDGDAVDAYEIAYNSKEVTIGCTPGTKDIYAIVNAPNLSKITSKEALLNNVSTIENSMTSFHMFGMALNEDIEEDGHEVTIEVDRFASRIVVKKVTNALTSNYLKNKDFKLKSMYITNVAGDIDYGMSPDYTVSKWYNQMGCQSKNTLGSLINDSIDAKIPSNSSHASPHFFYAYPNSNDYSSSDTWSPRATMLVLKVEINEKIYDYPIILPALERNKSYEIDEIKITRLGNLDDGVEGGSDEQVPVEGMDALFEITVNPWTVVTVTEGTTI